MTYRINVLASWGAHVVVLLTGLILTPYIIRVAGEHAYGGWIVLNGIAGYSRLLYLGFGETICRYAAKHSADGDAEALNRVASCTLAVYLGSACVALLVGLTLAWAAPSIGAFAASGLPIDDIRLALVLLAMNAAVSISGSVYGGLLMGLQRFDLERGTQTAVTVTRLVLTLVFLHTEQPLTTLAAIFLAVSTIEVLLMRHFARRLLPGLKMRLALIDRATVRETVGFSIFTSTAVISEQLVYSTDAIVIGGAIGLAAAGVYSIAHRLCEMLRQPIHQVGIVSLPRASELHELETTAGKQSGELARFVLGAMSLSLLLTGGALIGAAFFGDRLIRVWMAGSWSVETAEANLAMSFRIMLILVAAQVIALPVGIMRKALVGIGFVKTPAKLVLAGALCNLGLSLLMVRPLGAIGVALGTLIPIVLIDAVLLLPLGMRQLAIDPRVAAQEVIGRNLLPLAALLIYCLAAASLPIPENWATIAVISGLGGAVTLVARFGTDILLRPQAVLRGGTSQ